MSVKFKLDWSALEAGDKVHLKIRDHDLTWWKANGINPGDVVEAVYDAECDALNFPEPTGCACAEEHLLSNYVEAVLVEEDDTSRPASAMSCEELVVINLAATSAALALLTEVPGIPSDAKNLAVELVDDLEAFTETF